MSMDITDSSVDYGTDSVLVIYWGTYSLVELGEYLYDAHRDYLMGKITEITEPDEVKGYKNAGTVTIKKDNIIQLN